MSSFASSSSHSAHSDEKKMGLWLLWLGIGLGAWLASCGSHWLLSQGVLVAFVALWAAYNVDPRFVVRGVLFTLIDAFFKDFDVAGSVRVPDAGPIILACAPHANQFVDPICIQKACAKRRDIGFLAAAKTVRRRYVGQVCKILQAIPVERAQDLAVVGVGTFAVSAGSVTVKGHGTQFDTQSKPGDLLVVTAPAKYKGCTSRIRAIGGAGVATMKRAFRFPAGHATGSEGVVAEHMDAVSFKIHPLLDQSCVFEAVFDRLERGGAIGIFPEGGSHDRTELLPLKGGVSIMALGAMAKYPSLCAGGGKLKIIPVGINYFEGHRFRSRVFVDIGEPIVPDPALVEQYKRGGDERRAAQGELLASVKMGLEAVTVQAPDFNTLQFLRALRRLYKATGIRAGAQHRMDLMHAFSKSYSRDRDLPRVQQLYDDVLAYREQLSNLGISDHRVSRASLGGGTGTTILGSTTLVLQLATKSIYLVLCAVVFLPGIILIWPWRAFTRYVSAKKAKEALRKSDVKIKGNDVLATWKLMTTVTLVPIQHTLYTCLSYYFFGESSAVAFFFFAPFVAIVTVLSTERGRVVYASMRPLYMALAHPERAVNLAEHRTKLKKQVRELVKDLRWDAELGKNTLYHRRSSIDSQASDFEPSQMMAAGLIPDFEEEDDEEEE
jgi:glycerol-3-phosphate O-acyltransferase / dihydroxyacetone phosphate acyltransferase